MCSASAPKAPPPAPPPIEPPELKLDTGEAPSDIRRRKRQGRSPSTGVQTPQGGGATGLTLPV